MYKTLNHETPEYLSSKFINRTDVTPYHLRNTVNKLALPLPRTEHFKKSFLSYLTSLLVIIIVYICVIGELVSDSRLIISFVSLTYRPEKQRRTEMQTWSALIKVLFNDKEVSRTVVK